MIFLEGVLVNVIICVMCMYVDRYALNDYCRRRPLLDFGFKMWLVVTFATVTWALIKSLSVLEIV